MGWMEDIANQAATAEVFGAGNYFTDGVYPRLVVESLTMKDGNQGQSFIGEFFIEESRDSEPGVSCRPVGSRASVVFNVTKHRNVALSNIKKLALALAGMNEEQLAAEQDNENRAAAAAGRQAVNVLGAWILRAVSNANPARGICVAGATYRHATKDQKSKNAPREDWNAYVNFESIDGGAAPGAVAAARARLDGQGAAPVQTVAAPPPAPIQAPAPTPIQAPAPAPLVAPSPAPIQAPAPLAAPATSGGLLSSLGA